MIEVEPEILLANFFMPVPKFPIVSSDHIEFFSTAADAQPYFVVISIEAVQLRMTLEINKEIR